MGGGGSARTTKWELRASPPPAGGLRFRRVPLPRCRYYSPSTGWSQFVGRRHARWSSVSAARQVDTTARPLTGTFVDPRVAKGTEKLALPLPKAEQPAVDPRPLVVPGPRRCAPAGCAASGSLLPRRERVVTYGVVVPLLVVEGMAWEEGHPGVDTITEGEFAPRLIVKSWLGREGVVKRESCPTTGRDGSGATAWL